MTADGKSIYVSSAGDDTIVHLRRGAGGVLVSRGCVQDSGKTRVECDRFAEGLDGPRDLLLSPGEQQLYVASTSEFAVTTFDRAVNGKVTEVGCIADDDLADRPAPRPHPGWPCRSASR